MRSLLALVMAALTVFAGCAANAYRVPNDELVRLSQIPPAERGRSVRVIQELGTPATQHQDAVGPDTEIIIVPQINISTGPRYTRDHRWGGGSVGSGGGKLSGGGSGSDGKAEAIAIIVAAVLVLFIVAGIEGSRFDGYSQIHPMHPVHLFGKNGEYTVMPLAWIDQNAAAWTEKAVLIPNEGPWRTLQRAPLWRDGMTYGVYAGTGTFYSAYGDRGAGPSFTIQAGYFFNQWVGILGDVMFGWRDNRVGDTAFETRTMLELQALPLRAGIFHAGAYAGIGHAWRFEDNVAGGDAGTAAFSGGAMFQLDINTRIALTARFGVTRVYDQRTTDLVFGMSVY